MAKISTYPSAEEPLLLSDRLIGTEAIRPIPSPTPLATKNFSLGELLLLFSDNFPAASLQAVLDTGNTATQNITLVGTIDTTLIKPDNIEDTSGSQGLTFQFLSKGTSSINWVDLPIDNLQSVLNAGNTATQNITLVGNITSTKIIPGNIQDETSVIGTTGQVLSKTATGIKWITNPASYTAGLADVLSVGNTSILDANIGGLGLYDLEGSAYATLTAFDHNFTFKDYIGDTALYFEQGILGIHKTNSIAGSFSTNLLTLSRLYELPDQSGTIALLSDIPSVTSAAMTKVDDTNVTLTLGGNPANSLLQAVSLTLGWTGTLADSRIASAATWNAKQSAISLTTTGSSGASTFLSNVLNIPNYTLSGLGGVPTSRTLTINGTTYDLSADRSWSISAGISSITATSPITSSGGSTPVISTSMNTNKLIGRYSSGTGVMQEITLGTGLSLNSSGILNAAASSPTGYFGAFQDILTQTLALANVGQPFLIRTIDESNQVSITANGSGQLTRITPANTGVYNIQWSGQFQNPDNAIHDVNVWFRKGLTSSSGPGTDVVGSNGIIAMPARKSAVAGEQGHVVAGWNFVLTIAAGEYVEFYWMSDSTQITLQAYPAGSPPPSTASLIVTVTQQAGIMAGTGITAINSLTGASQTLTTGTSGLDFNIISTGTSHTFNLPTASATTRGALSATDWSTFNGKQNALTNPITGIGTINYLPKFNGSTTSLANSTIQDSGSLVTISSATKLIGLQTLQGTTASDAGQLGVELLTTGSGTNWTGTSFSTGYTHTVGSTVALSAAVGIITGNYYQVAYTITGRTAGSVTITVGGLSITSITSSGTWGPKVAAPSGLTITPTSDFNGTIIVSIKLISASSATTTFFDSFSYVSNEIRASYIPTNLFFGVGTGKFNTTGYNNSFIGYNAGSSNSTGYDNSFIGQNAGLANTTGTSNLGIGNSAMATAVTQIQNTAIGHLAGYITRGDGNTFVGYTAGRGNGYLGSGSNNVFVGSLSGNANSSSSYSVVVGSNAGNYGTGSGNIAIGYAANYQGGAGQYNSVLGYAAAYAQTGGSYNLMLGYIAGQKISGGVTNANSTGTSVLLGAGTQVLTDGGSNEIVIGYNATGLGSNSVTLGNDSITKTALKGQIAIGTTAPVASAKVQIDSTTQGFLPPRMTNAQRIAISSPAIGLCVYCTDATEGLYVNKSTGWVMLL